MFTRTQIVIHVILGLTKWFYQQIRNDCQKIDLEQFNISADLSLIKQGKKLVKTLQQAKNDLNNLYEKSAFVQSTTELITTGKAHTLSSPLDC